MRWNRTIQTVDVHCAGEIGRVITGGVLDIPGRTMAEKLHHLNTVDDGLRRWLCSEPRSGPAGSFCLLTPPCDPAAGSVADRLACRIRSFTGETDPGTARTYTFDNLRPGSFLLQSGTHPQAQVQMGLAALLKLDAAPLDLTARRLYAAEGYRLVASEAGEEFGRALVSETWELEL